MKSLRNCSMKWQENVLRNQNLSEIRASQKETTTLLQVGVIIPLHIIIMMTAPVKKVKQIELIL